MSDDAHRNIEQTSVINELYERSIYIDTAWLLLLRTAYAGEVGARGINVAVL